MKHRYLEAGKIVNTHGIAGEVKILPWADDPAFLLDFDTLYIDGQPVSLLGARVHKNCVLAKLAGIHDINEAMKLKNKVVFIDREDAELEEGAFFLAGPNGAGGQRCRQRRGVGADCGYPHPSCQQCLCGNRGEAGSHDSRCPGVYCRDQY